MYVEIILAPPPCRHFYFIVLFKYCRQTFEQLPPPLTCLRGFYTPPFEKVLYKVRLGYHGKNGLVSDNTERTLYLKIYSTQNQWYKLV